MLTQMGLIGLGKMGFPLAQNVLDQGIEVIAFDLSPEAIQKATDTGIPTATSIADLLATLKPRRVVWMMVPAGPIVDETIEKVLPHLSPGDILIDGGNSFYKDTLRRFAYLKEKGVDYLDCGTSGGVSGARHGVCAMIGGMPEVFSYCEELFRKISVENGYVYAGQPASGHYVKMVHNGIEYGMMQAIAEGFELMERSDFDMDLASIAKVWNHGSVIRSWLIELTENALRKDPHLDQIKGIMHASGEGLWTVQTALNEGVPTPVIALSLMMRHRSQNEDTFSGKVVAALRNEFGGHKVEKAD